MEKTDLFAGAHGSDDPPRLESRAATQEHPAEDGTGFQHKPMRIAMIGTRGVPAAYGGFETAVEEIGSRLAAAGHEVVVYCRGRRKGAKDEFRGMQLVHRGALHLKAAETLSHTALSVVHTLTHRRPDMAFVFNAANAPFVRPLQMRGIPVAVHVDGLEWKRDKWGGTGKRYYRWAEQHSVLHADALIADAKGIADYYSDEFGALTDLISYGAPIQRDAPSNRLAEVGLTSNGFHLVVARFEPENHVDVIAEGYANSAARLPLVVVGTAPYAAEHSDRITEIARDPRIRLLGGVYDQELLDQLYAHAATYVHGHSVGGTNPSLLRAMGAATAVIAWDVVFNRSVAPQALDFFGSSDELSQALVDAEAHPERVKRCGAELQARAETNYRWDRVAADYELLAARLIAGHSTRGIGHRRATRVPEASGHTQSTAGTPQPEMRTP